MGCQPTITIAIPTRNRSGLLVDAIDSALAQTFTDTEILVLDDDSSDDTCEVVARYADPRLRYVRHHPNIGMAANWNYGYEHGRGRYVAVLHDDDYWAPTFLDRALTVFQRQPDAGFVYAAVVPVDLDRRIIGDRRLALSDVDLIMPPATAVERLVKATEVGWPAILVRRAAMLEIGGFTEDFPYHKDWAAWIQLAARYPVGFLAETLGCYRIHPGQFSVEYGAELSAIASDRHAMLRRTIPGLPLPAAERDRLLKLALRALAETQLVSAWELARNGDRKRARTEARYAFSIDRGVAWRTPQLVAAAYAASFLPRGMIRSLDHWRAQARPLFRRS
jgi:hypothetical protein